MTDINILKLITNTSRITKVVSTTLIIYSTIRIPLRSFWGICIFWKKKQICEIILKSKKKIQIHPSKQTPPGQSSSVPKTSQVVSSRHFPGTDLLAFLNFRVFGVFLVFLVFLIFWVFLVFLVFMVSLFFLVFFVSLAFLVFLVFFVSLTFLVFLAHLHLLEKRENL